MPPEHVALGPQAEPVGALVAPHAQSPDALQLSPGPQALPHAPQAEVVLSARSQPFVRLPSQSPNPEAHAM
jgi:hypothetical protein